MTTPRSRSQLRRARSSSSAMASSPHSEGRGASSSTVSNGSEGRPRLSPDYSFSRGTELSAPDRSPQSPQGGQSLSNGEDGIRRGLRVTSRVHRACTACRRQKMRCEGPVNGPCNRCQASHQDCVFEKPPKDAPSNGLSDAGLARLSAIEAQMNGMQSVLARLTDQLEVVSQTQSAMGPWTPQPSEHLSIHSGHAGTIDAAPDRHAILHHLREPRARSDISIDALTSPRGTYRAQASASRLREPITSEPVGNNAPPEPPAPPSSVKRDFAEMALENGDESTDRDADFTNDELGAPIEALRGLADAAAARHPEQATRHVLPFQKRGDTRHLLSEDQSVKRRKENHSEPDENVSAPGRQLSIDRSRQTILESDLVTTGAIGVQEARKLWDIFMQGCPKFIGVFSPQARVGLGSIQSGTLPGSESQSISHEATSLTSSDEFQATRLTSPFLFATILWVGAKIGLATDTDTRSASICLERAQLHAQETLFRPTTLLTKEDVMALNLMASYCDSGWVLCGHAIRIAQELRLDQAFTSLQKLVHSDSSLLAATTPMRRKDRQEEDYLCELSRGARLWFFSFLLEHQISYGAGKPAMLHRALVSNCRDFLKLRQPLTTPIDARFVSTLELMVLREQHRDCLAPFDGDIDQAMHKRVSHLNEDLYGWLEYWAKDFRARGHTDDNFYMGSLRLQCATAKLYLTCTVLRKTGQENAEWSAINAWQRSLVTQAVKAADQTLRIAVENKEYFDLLKWAPHYTIVTATFAAVFLLKALRMYPSSQLISTRGLQDIFRNAEKLAMRFMEFPAASKYGSVILQMLWHAFKFIVGVNKRKGLSVIFRNGIEKRDASQQSVSSPALQKSGLSGLDPGSATRGTLSALHDSPIHAVDDAASSRGYVEDDDTNDATLRNLDAILASIDWDTVNQCDFRQILCDIDQRQHDTSSREQHNNPRHASDAISTPSQRPIGPVHHTVYSQGTRSNAGASQEENRDTSAKLDGSVSMPFHVPAWVQPQSFGAEPQADWPMIAGRSADANGSQESRNAQIAGSRSSSHLARLSQSTLTSALTLPAHLQSTGNRNDEDMAAQAMPGTGTFSSTAATPNHLQSFDQIALELDLGDTLAELFAPSGNVSPVEGGTGSRSKSFSIPRRDNSGQNVS